MIYLWAVISQIRNSNFSQFFWIFMGLYLLNLSVDMADPDSLHVAEDLTFNDQESIIELVVETFLGYEDAFQEFDDPDAEEQTQKSQGKIDLINNIFQDFLTQTAKEPLGKQKFLDYEEFLSIGYSNLFTPPPQV